jgi:PEP-CTERM motif
MRTAPSHLPLIDPDPALAGDDDCAMRSGVAPLMGSPRAATHAEQQIREVAMNKRSSAMARRWATALLLAGMGVVGNASATLMDRGPDMVYDSALNITWTRNANLPGSSNLTWADANAWAASLVVDGLSGWRLPYASVIAGKNGFVPRFTTLPEFPAPACTGLPGGEVACRDNEMGYMFYYNLHGTVLSSKTGTQIGDGVTLNNIQANYWSGTNCGANCVWIFQFDRGQNNVANPGALLSAWAVRPGDVIAAAPEPASLLLIGVGMLGLGWSRQRGRRGA